MCKAVETVTVLCFVVNLVLKSNTQQYFQLLENPSKMLQAAAISSVLSKHLVFVSWMLNHHNVELPAFPSLSLFSFLVLVLILIHNIKVIPCPFTTSWNLQFLRGGTAPGRFPKLQVSEMVKCLMQLIICLKAELDLPSPDKYFSLKDKKRQGGNRRGHAWSFNFVCLLVPTQSVSVLIAAPVRLQYFICPLMPR